MTRDEVIEMARQAASHGVENHRSGEVSFVFYNEHLMNFAKLVATKEREACAEIAEKQRYAINISLTSNPAQNGTAVGILNRIRARSNPRGEA